MPRLSESWKALRAGVGAQCGGKVQETFAKKLFNCSQCDFGDAGGGGEYITRDRPNLIIEIIRIK
jgi:hypothetical protein